MTTLNNHSTESASQSAYDRDVMGEGIDRMTAAGIDPHGDGGGEPATELVYTPADFHNDCGDLCLPHDKEGTAKLMQYCKDALESLDDVNRYPGCRLRFSHSLVFRSQLIGEIVINQLLANNITADMLEVENG